LIGDGPGLDAGRVEFDARAREGRYNARSMSAKVVVSQRGADRLRAGHPWIYRSDVVQADAEPGDLVEIVSERKRPLGCAFWSSTSQIALRYLGAARITDEAAVFVERLRAAVEYRASLAIDGDVCRLVHGEADRLPGLIVDKYGPYLVIQTLVQGTDRRLAMITQLLVDLLKPTGILARNDPKVRRLEGLDERIEAVHGDVPEEIEVREGSVRFRIDVWHGQKTGMFLDQRENHQAAARYGRGRALDAFTYHGGFALTLAPVCDRVLAIDSSSQAVEATRCSADLNGIANVEVREANVFDELRELEVSGERFETVVLDPPAFAKNRASVERAAAGYKEINLRALKLLAPGGHLITCSCSYNISEPLFLDIVGDAAADAHATVSLVEKRLQARDHPVLVNIPETYYLKCLVLRKLA
jgi:23S rRNA (cytosine1962-C5)-methyltransferase